MNSADISIATMSWDTREPQNDIEKIISVMVLRDSISTSANLSRNGFNGGNTDKEEKLLKTYMKELLRKHNVLEKNFQKWAWDLLKIEAEKYINSIICTKCPFFDGHIFSKLFLMPNVYAIKCARPNFKHVFREQLNPRWFCQSLIYQLQERREKLPEVIDYDEMQKKIYQLIEIQYGNEELNIFQARELEIKQNQ